jgi:hypothetical protein
MWYSVYACTAVSTHRACQKRRLVTQPWYLASDNPVSQAFAFHKRANSRRYAAVRPLFPKDYQTDTSIQAIVLASDRSQDPAVLAVNAA